LLQTGLFQNSCIVFTVPGLSFRKPGRFIGIDKPNGSPNNTFSDKFYGQWFIIDVKHFFEKGAYYNTIIAVKIHRYTDNNKLGGFYTGSYVGDVNINPTIAATA
jgi:hypothetical protein